MRKVYEKPYPEVVEYVGDYGYATSTTNTCKYLTCLIGNQSSENIEGLNVYTYENNGTTYYIWKYNYGTTSGSENQNIKTYISIISSWLKTTDGVDSGYSNSDMSSGFLHIATDDDNVYNES